MYLREENITLRVKTRTKCCSDHVCSDTPQTGNFPTQDKVHQKSSDPPEPGKPAVHGNGLWNDTSACCDVWQEKDLYSSISILTVNNCVNVLLSFNIKIHIKFYYISFKQPQCVFINLLTRGASINKTIFTEFFLFYSILFNFLNKFIYYGSCTTQTDLLCRFYHTLLQILLLHSPLWPVLFIFCPTVTLKLALWGSIKSIKLYFTLPYFMLFATISNPRKM